MNANKISVAAWISFNVKWISGQVNPHLRFGQAFIGECVPKVNDPAVFHEEDHKKAVAACCEKYVDHSDLGANRNSEEGAALSKLVKENILKRQWKP
jgi:hypothetical protein